MNRSRTILSSLFLVLFSWMLMHDIFPHHHHENESDHIEHVMVDDDHCCDQGHSFFDFLLGHYVHSCSSGDAFLEITSTEESVKVHKKNTFIVDQASYNFDIILKGGIHHFVFQNEFHDYNPHNVSLKRGPPSLLFA